MTEVPIELRKAILNNDLVLFVGAGLSFNLVNTNNQPIKGWNNLVENILINLSAKGHYVEHLKPLVGRYDPIKVLDLIESDKILPKKDIYKFIKDFLELNQLNNLELHKKLFELSSKIITTNYDTAFEQAVPKLRTSKAYKGRNYELTTHREKDAVLLFKLHGCFEDGDSMVLFPSNYKNLYENTDRDAEHSLLVLRNIIHNKTILFVGVGIGDFQINNIFKEIGRLQGEYNQKHFIITNKTLDSALNFLTRINISDFNEINTIIDSLLSIKKESNNYESHEIFALKKQLEEANKKIEELKNTSDKDKLLEREALKYYSRGVKLSLSNQSIKAIEEYKIAVELKPDFADAFHNWGSALDNMADTKQGTEADELYMQACEKYQIASEIKSDDYEIFFNWGSCLLNFAKKKEGTEADELYMQACEKYQIASEMKSDDHETFNNWGSCLLNFAKKKEGTEADELYQLAFDIIQKAIANEGISYNLSCFYALNDDKENALKYLEIALSKNEISIEFVEKDEDWKDFYNDIDFKSILAKYK